MHKALAEPTGQIEHTHAGHVGQIEAQRQRDLDAALADAVEVVARQRQRLGRRTCTPHDGATVRKINELLRGMLADGSVVSFQ